MKTVILDGYTTNPGDLSWDFLNEFGEFTVYDYTPAEKIVQRATGFDIIITNKTPISAQTMAQLPRLKFIALLSTGFNVIDIEYAKERGIPVSNVPSYSTAAVAQLVFAFLLEFANKVCLHDEAVREGEWSAGRHFCFWKAPLMELQGKTMGIIGFGQIGREVAKLARAFGMKVAAYSRSLNPGDSCEEARIVTLDELLRISDVVTLHCPLNPQTEKMVDRDFLSKMKKTAFLINTSRGAVIDENALAQALKAGDIAGAGVDVLSAEPPTEDNPLPACENCLITPHIAWAGFETRTRLIEILGANIRAFINGNPKNVVNN